MAQLPEFTATRDLRIGQDAAQEAWLRHFLIENNLDHALNPAYVASPEQLRFMVDLDDDQVYVPCADDLFRQLYQGGASPEFLKAYARAWQVTAALIRASGADKSIQRRALHLCRHSFRLCWASRKLLPSRLIKRLLHIVLEQLGDMDPFREKKQQANATMAAVLARPEYIRLLQALPHLGEAATIAELRRKLDYAELLRLLRMSTCRGLWDGDAGPDDLAKDFAVDAPESECLQRVFDSGDASRKKILYLPDRAGGFMVDLAIIRSLLRQGHQVVLALKDGCYFHAPVLWDLETDPVLQNATEGMFLLHDDGATKNALLRHLRENRLVVISDGTSEQLNLYLVSVTFARAWKECDVVMVKGKRNAESLLGASHAFTRDILCFWRDEGNIFSVQYRPKSARVRKFSESDIIAQADAVIAGMHAAKTEGKSVMFYSAVIGSIPGQTQVALAVVNRFVQHLRERLEHTFIINPAEHFIEGMDGDDLMFMWERVQRSGYLDVWRFQTVDDIEISFALLGRKVPAAWLGKDATFSTGCTKEMQIAVDLQAKHPELQIIGPAPERFFRRREYGVGKYFDARIAK